MENKKPGGVTSLKENQLLEVGNIYYYVMIVSHHSYSGKMIFDCRVLKNTHPLEYVCEYTKEQTQVYDPTILSWQIISEKEYLTYKRELEQRNGKK